ncbi:MAG: hypothetical protein KF681_06305 [Bdellovibrionaceae bacterium]|nr:hypothetical protein [Pseudobdellovibrionaceae bacterium]
MKNSMNGLADQAESKANHMAREAKSFAKDASSEAKSLASDAQGYAEEGLKSIQDAAMVVRDQAQAAWKRSDEVLKANPYYFVAGTAVAGLALGYLLGRSRRN